MPFALMTAAASGVVKMLDQGPGGVRLLGSGTDACGVDEPVLELPREGTDKLHALGGQQVKG